MLWKMIMLTGVDWRK